MSLRVSITSKKAEHALLLLRGQRTISLFLKDPADVWRRGGKRRGWGVWAGPGLQSASLADPEGNFFFRFFIDT